MSWLIVGITPDGRYHGYTTEADKFDRHGRRPCKTSSTCGGRYLLPSGRRAADLSVHDRGSWQDAAPLCKTYALPDKMRVRRHTVEHPFGTIKAWMGATHFQMRRLPKVATEMALPCWPTT
jgi:Transposase DDE domain